MAKSGFTIEACPGCGEKNERKKNSVCPECHSLMETGRMYRREYELLNNTESFIQVKIPCHYELPNFISQRFQNLDSFKEIGEILKQLTFVLSAKKGMRPSWGYMKYLENRLTFEEMNSAAYDTHVMFRDDRAYNKNYQHQADAIIHKDVMNKLEKLYELIQLALNETEIKAVEYGKNILFQLNDGKLTMFEFDKK